MGADKVRTLIVGVGVLLFSFVILRTSVVPKVDRVAGHDSCGGARGVGGGSLGGV